MSEVDPGEPTIASAAWRFKLIVVLSLLGGLIAGLGYAFTQPQQFKATADLLLQDPRTAPGTVGNVNAEPTDRYIGDQIAVLKTPQIADAASAAAARRTPAVNLPSSYFASHTSVSGSQSTIDLVQVSFTGSDEASALAGVDSIVVAYKNVVHMSVADQIAPVLAQVDSSTNSIQLQINQINTVLPTTPAASDQHQALALQLQNLLARKAALSTQRDQLVVEAARGNDGVANYGQPQTAVRQSRLLSGLPIILGLAVLGLAGGLVAAYVLASRRRIITSGAEAAAVLHVPLIAELPAAAPETTRSLEGRVMTSAEAGRTAAVVLQARRAPQECLRVAVLSADRHQGRSMVCAGLALALAEAGNRVLVVDLDDTEGGLRALLGHGLGTTAFRRVPFLERKAGDISLDGSAGPELANGGPGILLVYEEPEPLGSSQSDVPLRLVDVVEHLSTQVDFVLFDTPPIMELGRGFAVIRTCQWVLPIVPHNELLSEVVKLAAVLDSAGLQPIGLIYNRVPRWVSRAGKRWNPVSAVAPNADASSAA
jgi:Mrp family chromosome partitioning ATPase